MAVIWPQPGHFQGQDTGCLAGQAAAYTAGQLSVGKAHEAPRTVLGVGQSSISALPTGSKAASLQLEPIGPWCAPGALKRRGTPGYPEL